MEGRFVVKMKWRKREGLGGHVQRVIEGLDVKIISVVVNVKGPDVMSSTAFVEVTSPYFDLLTVNFFSFMSFRLPYFIFYFFF